MELPSDNGIGDATAGDQPLAAGTNNDSAAAAVADDGGGLATSATGVAGSSFTTAGAAELGIIRVDTDGERPRRDDGAPAALFPDAAVRLFSSISGPVPADAAARGDVDGALDKATLGVRLPETEPRAAGADPDAAALSARDDESGEPGSAAAIPHPAKTAAPAPRAAASPRT